MSAITCLQCGIAFQLGAGAWWTLTHAGHNKSFCCTSCLREWLAEATA